MTIPKKYVRQTTTGLSKGEEFYHINYNLDLVNRSINF